MSDDDEGEYNTITHTETGRGVKLLYSKSKVRLPCAAHCTHQASISSRLLTRHRRSTFTRRHPLKITFPVS